MGQWSGLWYLGRGGPPAGAPRAQEWDFFFLYPPVLNPPGSEQSSEIFRGLSEPKGSQKVQQVMRGHRGLAEQFLFSPWEPKKVLEQVSGKTWGQGATEGKQETGTCRQSDRERSTDLGRGGWVIFNLSLSVALPGSWPD